MNSTAELEAEAGITASNASAVAGAGAGVLVAGESVFQTQTPVIDAVRGLRGAAEKTASPTQ